MAISVTVLYPNVDDATFDMKYYQDSHMPMVASEFKEFGFKGYRVLKFLGTPDPNTKSPYSVQCSLEFDTVENFTKALQAKASVVLGDVPNFSNKGPELLIGEEVATA